jgi:hypothetical protein
MAHATTVIKAEIVLPSTFISCYDITNLFSFASIQNRVTNLRPVLSSLCRRTSLRSSSLLNHTQIKSKGRCTWNQTLPSILGLHFRDALSSLQPSAWCTRTGKAQSAMGVLSVMLIFGGSAQLLALT